MIFWGYSIPEGKTIDYDKNSKELAEFVAKKVPDSSLCIGCGGCTATCTAGNLTDFNIRKLQMLIKRGDTQEAKEKIHTCMLCGKCLLVCPRGVNTRRMILAIMEYIRQ